jgi:hypothetical protein
MAKSKEDIIQITTKHYYDVQAQEIESLDAQPKHHAAFDKEAKAAAKTHATTRGKIDAEVTATNKDFDSQNAAVDARFSDREKEIAANVKAAKLQRDKDLAAHQKRFDKLVADLDRALEKSEATYQKQLAKLDADLAKQIDASNKNIADIEEKGDMDEAGFKQKLADLLTKHDEKITQLNEKEQTKIAKLTESNEQKIASIEAMIAKEEAKHNQKRTEQDALHQEELAEIDAKIARETAEYEAKRDNIKDSLAKRVAVREKHLQRALNDNDKRSAKQHKKDITRFQKEAERDLVVLEKTYLQQQKESTAYRKQFLQDHLEETAKQQQAFAEYKEDKTLQIELERLHLAHAIQTTKLEYDALRTKEQQDYDKSFATIRDKQETALMQRKLAMEQERHNQSVFAIETDMAKDTLSKEYEDDNEVKAKERRVYVLEKDKDDSLTNNTYDESMVRLAADGDVAALEHQRDHRILDHERAIALHKIQDKRHLAIKTEFVTYQQHIAPLFLNRMRDIKAYEDKEVAVRLERKQTFYQAMRSDLDADYEALIAKANATHDEEAAFLNTQIEALAGDKTKALNEYIDAQEAQLNELRHAAEALTEFKDRKERKQIEQQYDDIERAYQAERQHRTAELEAEVGAYRTLLADVEARRDQTLQDLKDTYERSARLLDDAMEQHEEHTTRELATASHLVSATDSAFEQYQSRTTARTDQQQAAHEAYLNTQLAREQSGIELANQQFVSDRDQRHQTLQQDLDRLEKDRQSALSDYQANVSGEADRLRDIQAKIAAELESIRHTSAKRIEQANNDFTTVKNNLTTDLNEVSSVIKTTLQTQTNTHNQRLASIDKDIQSAQHALEDNEKQLRKTSADRLKETIRVIRSDLQLAIQQL